MLCLFILPIFLGLNKKLIFLMIFNCLLDYFPQVNSLSEEHQKLIISESLYWSRAGCEIRLERNIKKYLINYYFPAGILVPISWVSSNKACISNFKSVFKLFVSLHSTKKGKKKVDFDL